MLFQWVLGYIKWIALSILRTTVVLELNCDLQNKFDRHRTRPKRAKQLWTSDRPLHHLNKVQSGQENDHRTSRKVVNFISEQIFTRIEK